MKREINQVISSEDEFNEPNSCGDFECSVALGVEWNQLGVADLSSFSSKDRIQCLFRVAHLLPLMTGKQQKKIGGLLVDRLTKEIDVDVKAMLALLLEKFSRFFNINAAHLLESLTRELTSTSTKVRCQLYNCIISLIKGRQVVHDNESRNILTQLLKRVISELSDPHYRVRAVCIRLLSLLPFVLELWNNGSRTKDTSAVVITQLETQKVISSYVLDSDPRVRKSALNALVGMHLRGSPLDSSLYPLAVKSLHDDFEEVRMGGLGLVWTLSSLYPDHKMKLAHEEIQDTVRLIDDAFVKLCDLVNDSSVVVRTKACVMMASYQHVDFNVMSQTFSKRIMSNLRRRLGFSTYRGQKKPSTVTDGNFDASSSEFRLLDSGACGAFVHGLEDEFQEVRSAAIDSICELCMYNDKLIRSAVDCLVDMFNDEIDRVRINAIQSLRKIGTRETLSFNAEQLEIAVGALEDNDQTAREATHELIRVIRVDKEQSMQTLLDALMANMKRFPEDQLSIFRCLRDIGKRHGDYLGSMVPSLLNLDRRYLPREPAVEDSFYTSNVILIANACTTNMSISEMLPKFIYRHFAYYKSKYPDCIPDLRKMYKAANIVLQGDIDCLATNFAATASLVTDDVEKYMDATLDMLKTIGLQLERKDYTGALLTIEAANRNFEYIGTLKPSLAGKSELAILYLQCCELVVRIKQSHSSPTYAVTAQMAAASLLRLSYTIEHTFLGISTETLHSIMYFRALANITWMFGMLKQIPISNKTPFTIKNMLVASLQRMSLIEGRFHKDNNKCLEISALRSDLAEATTSPSTAKVYALQSFVNTFLPLPVYLNKPIRHTSAVITSPISNIDKPYRFMYQFPTELRVEADILNVSDVNDIAIEIVYPDKTSSMFWPAADEFKPVTPYCYKLNASIVIKFAMWTETAVVEISVVRSFEPDLPGLDDYIMKYPNAKPQKASNNFNTTATTSISEPLKYSLYPTKL
ncbi:armadillo-type protein [Phycomyces nitens]|nr:armadillo-type protein [Phycomyces nitens]